MPAHGEAPSGGLRTIVTRFDDGVAEVSRMVRSGMTRVEAARLHPLETSPMVLVVVLPVWVPSTAPKAALTTLLAAGLLAVWASSAPDVELASGVTALSASVTLIVLVPTTISVDIDWYGIEVVTGSVGGVVLELFALSMPICLVYLGRWVGGHPTGRSFAGVMLIPVIAPACGW